MHGPGCPVCVIPMGRIDDAIAVAETPGVIFTSFGDMMRVPGGNGTLLEAKARGADVRFVYSPLDALKIAVDNPDREVVFFAVGFETTAPSTAVTLLKARDDQVINFSVFSNHVTIVPPIKAILESPDLRLDGFLGPGHVSTVVGNHPYRFVTQEYGKPLVTAGFEPLDILQAIAMLLAQIREGRCEVENQYTRIVRDEGNPRALRFLAEVFELRPHFEWRGLGFIAQSALKLRDEFAAVGRRAALRGARGAGRRPEGLPVRRGAQGRHQAVGVQGVRHRVHAGDADRHLHGVVGGRLRGLLQLRPPPSRGRRHPRPGVGLTVHELSLCQAILEHVEARSDGRPVRQVDVRIGHLRQVVPDSLQFSWEMLTEGTDLDGVELVVEHVPAVVRCRACGADTTLDLPVLACATCEGLDVELRSGEELDLASIDVAEEVR